MSPYKLALRIGIVYLFCAAIPRMVYEFSRLLWQSGYLGAIDLRQRYEETHLWFSGVPIYEQVGSAVYPPASYAMFWPFLGYPTLTMARWVWAITTVAILIGLVCLLIRESGVSTPMEKTLIALLPLGMYASTITIGNGQVTILVITALVAGLSQLRKIQPWLGQLVTVFLLTLSLIKPTLSVPFFLIVLCLPGGLWRILLVGLGYGLLALVATSFQSENILSLHISWLKHGVYAAAWGSEGGGATQQFVDTVKQASESANVPLGSDLGYNDVHSLMGSLGLEQWNMHVSLGLLVILGIWIFVHRSTRLWSLIGITAIITRVFVYHRVYDDMLILLPMVTLIQFIKSDIDKNLRKTSVVLFVIAFLSSTVPASLRLLPPPQDSFFKLGQLIVWLLILTFLLYVNWGERIRRFQEQELHPLPKGVKADV